MTCFPAIEKLSSSNAVRGGHFASDLAELRHPGSFERVTAIDRMTPPQGTPPA